MRILLLSLVVALAIGCQRSESKIDNLGASGAQSGELESTDILKRTETAPVVDVKHVLIGWKDLTAAYQGRQMDPRAQKRTKEEAEKLAADVAKQLRADPTKIDALIKEHSEDPGSLRGKPYTIKPETPFVPEFKNLSLRLKPNEVGVVKTAFGYHVIVRVPPPAADPIESADILKRPEGTGEVQIQHVLIGWKDSDSQDPRAKARTKADADKLAQEVLAKAKAGEDMAKLMADYSEDPGSKDSGNPYPVSKGSGMIGPFEAMALRLNIGEAGLVKTDFGWHVMKRVPPPPPDPLESADILAREPDAGEVQVQHVLLGWKGTQAQDPRAQARTKADADKLAQEILAKIKAGGDMAKLMKQYSEDPGSKDTGKPYPVAKGSGMVPPFEALSLRLKVGEAGLVKTDFGWHVIKRVPPPPPDTLESADILARPVKTQKAKVKHILLGWKDVHARDPRGEKRSRAELEKLVKDTVAKLKKGEKIEPLMKDLSEDPGSAASGKEYDVTPDAGLVPPFKNLSLRLDVNEVGVVKTDFGIHIIQRVE